MEFYDSGLKDKIKRDNGGEDMKPGRHRNLVCCLIVGFGSLCFAQVITIRVIDTRNGHPLPKREASLRLLYEKNETTAAIRDHTLLLETDVNGEAHFTLREPAPDRIEAWVGITSEEHWWCYCLLTAVTQDVVQKGIVGPQPGPWSKKSPGATKPVPGQFLFLPRPWTLFERLLAPLVRG